MKMEKSLDSDIVKCIIIYNEIENNVGYHDLISAFDTVDNELLL